MRRLKEICLLLMRTGQRYGLEMFWAFMKYRKVRMNGSLCLLHTTMSCYMWSEFGAIGDFLSFFFFNLVRNFLISPGFPPLFFSQVWTTHLLCSVLVKNRAYSAFSSLFDCQDKRKLTLDSELEQHLSKYRRLEDFRTEIVSIAGLMSCVPMDDFVKGGAGLGSCSFAGTFDVYGEKRGLISQSSPQNCKIWGRRHLLRNHLFNALLLSTMTSSSAFLSGPVCLSSHSQPLILWMELSRKQKQRPLNFGYHTQCARGPRWSLCSMSSCWGSLGYLRQVLP